MSDDLSRFIPPNARDYSNYQFLYPPRPETKNKIYPMQIPQWEARGFWAQYKKNGTNNGIAVAPSGELITRQRRNIPHINWAPSEHTKYAFRHLTGGWHYFITELIHSKVADGKAKGLSDINYIHDILVFRGKHLTGTTFAERQALLAELFDAKHLPVSSTGSHYIIDKHTWLARNHTKGFAKMFAGLSGEEDEGLVLKSPTAKLAPCATEGLNAAWMVKIRVPHGNYDA
jgi:hypothetical protein